MDFERILGVTFFISSFHFIMLCNTIPNGGRGQILPEITSKKMWIHLCYLPLEVPPGWRYLYLPLRWHVKSNPQNWQKISWTNWHFGTTRMHISTITNYLLNKRIKYSTSFSVNLFFFIVSFFVTSYMSISSSQDQSLFLLFTRALLMLTPSGIYAPDEPDAILIAIS